MSKETETEQSLHNLIETEEYLQKFVSSCKQMINIIPQVQICLEEIDLIKQTTSRRPDEAKNLPIDVFQEIHRLTSLLPMPSLDSENISIQISSTMSIANTAIFTNMIGTRETGKPELIEYANNYFNEHRILQEKHGYSSQVKKRMTEQWPTTLSRFEDTEKAVSQWKSDIIKPSLAANEMRNLLYAVKGEGQEEARKRSNKQLNKLQGDNKTWEDIAQYLNLTDDKKQQLIAQHKAYEELHANLSKTLKKRTDINIDTLWSMCLDHCMALLGIIYL